MISASFSKPLVHSTDAGVEEQIYGFSRRFIFSPEITGNRALRCCAVSGPRGVRSAGHTHPGDEVVISLRGENINFVAGDSLKLEKGQAIAVPPETVHSTTVTGTDGWKGISFYCDRCPFIKQSAGVADEREAKVKPLNVSFPSSAAGLCSHTLFSPRGRETAFMQISLLGGTGEKRGEFRHSGESVYIPLQGMFIISWSGGESVLRPGMAAAIPAGFRHSLSLDDSHEASLVICSCSSCSLAVFDRD